MAECLIYKQPIGAISRAVGAYCREKLFSSYTNRKSEKIDVPTNNQNEYDSKTSVAEPLKSVNFDEPQHTDL